VQKLFLEKHAYFLKKVVLLKFKISFSPLISKSIFALIDFYEDIL